MEELNSYIAKFLSHSVVVNIYSNPQFTVETFLAVIVSIVNLLLILEVNAVYEDAKSPARIRLLQNLKVSSSKGSYCTSVTKIQGIYNKSLISSFKKSEKNYSATSNYGWILPQYDGDTFTKRFLSNHKPKLDKLEHMLSISPSEYVRRDKEKRLQVTHVRECIRSLTRMLESKSDEQVSKEVIKKNLDVMQEQLNNLSTANDPAKLIMRETECIDETLYDLMESLVLSATLDNPLPHRNLKAAYSMLMKQPINKEFAITKIDTFKQTSSQFTPNMISRNNSKHEDMNNIRTTSNRSEEDEEEISHFELAADNSQGCLLQTQALPIMV